MRCLTVIFLGLFAAVAFAKDRPFICQAVNFDNQVVDQLSVLAGSKLDAKNIYMINHDMNPMAANEGIFITVGFSTRPNVVYEIKNITCLPEAILN